MIVLMAGLPGTGKSTLAHALASRLSGSVLSKDVIRHALFSDADVEYSTEQDDFVMQIMLEAAQWILRRHGQRAVFLDGRTFSRRYQIDRVIEAAQKLRQPWQIVECICSEDSARRRIESQANTGEHPATNRDCQLYVAVKARFEPITLPKIVIDTDMALDECVNRVVAALR
jgi:adenylylsulfate kinase